MVTLFHKGRNFQVVFAPGGSPAGDGAVVDGYDYDRVSGRAQIKYFPPFRFPGQYYDDETDLHENWNRYYDGLDGRYLSPEPLLQSPSYVRLMAQGGMSVPTYAYAANNPLRFIDPTGLNFNVISDRANEIWAEINAAKNDPIIGQKVRDLEADPNYTVDIFDWRNAPGPNRGSEAIPNGKNQCDVQVSWGSETKGDRYRHTLRTKLWHELGHAWAFREWGIPQDSDVGGILRNLREAVIWENRARMSQPDMSPLGAPSRLRRIHPPTYFDLFQ